MATATAPRNNTITLEYGAPQVLAFRFIEGKNLGDSKYPPFLPRVVFSTVDGRSLFLDSEDAGDLERGMRELGVDPKQGDMVRVTLVKHPKGGGHSLRVERHGEDAPGVSDVEKQLRDSLATLERARNAPVAVPLLERAREKAGASGNAPVHSTTNNTMEKPAPVVSEGRPSDSRTAAAGSFAKILAGALTAAIDGFMIASAYAESKGLSLTFSADNLTPAANTMLIEYFKREREAKGGRS